MKKWMILCGAALGLMQVQAGEPNPNVVFIMLDDLGYSQIEAYTRGLSVEDCDPRFLDYVEDKGWYSAAEAFEQVKRASPTLSRMADEGVRFNNAFAASNLCGPSRMGVATGIQPNRWGIYRNIDIEALGLKPHSHLAEQLHERGYATAHIGKWHVGSRDDDMVARIQDEHGIKKKVGFGELVKQHPSLCEKLRDRGYEGSVVSKDHPLNNGFDYYFGYNMWESPFYDARNVWENWEHAGRIKEYNTDVFTDKALEFISSSLKQNKPFYVQLHYHAVHSPLMPKAPEKYFKRFSTDSFMLNNFYAHIFGVDENVRRLNEFLDQHGVRENTLIVFTSDNGGSVGGPSCLPGNGPYAGHKGMMQLGGFRVPMFFYWPGGIKAPRNNNQLVSTLDILPTLIDAAGIAVPDGLDGKSLLPQMLGADETSVRPHLAMGGIHARAWGFNVDTGFFKPLVSREKAPAGYVVADDRYILRYVADIIPDLYRDVPEGVPAHFELYDYRADPGERKNIADQHPEKLQQLQQIWTHESAQFPKPVAWGEQKWTDIVGK
jgi:uncharacterized sulfatase